MQTVAESNTKTQQILRIMRVLSWILFILLCIHSGAIIFSFVISSVNPEGAKNLYKGLDLYSLRNYSYWHYTQHVSYMIAVAALQTFMLFLIIKALSKVNMINPFTTKVARIIEEISYVLFGIWVVGVLNNIHTAWLSKKGGIQLEAWDTGDNLFVAGLVFIISQVFKRGVEIQSENELTV